MDKSIFYSRLKPFNFSSPNVVNPSKNRSSSGCYRTGSRIFYHFLPIFLFSQIYRVILKRFYNFINFEKQKFWKKAVFCHFFAKKRPHENHLALQGKIFSTFLRWKRPGRKEIWLHFFRPGVMNWKLNIKKLENPPRAREMSKRPHHRLFLVFWRRFFEKP